MVNKSATSASDEKQARRRLEKPAITVKSKEGLRRIKRVFPWVVAAVDHGLLPPGYMSPAIRLEALRAIAGIELGEWRSGVNLGNWRTTNALADAVSPDPADHLEMRCTMRDLIAKLPSPVDLAWVLGGIAGIPELKTFEQRLRWALAIWQENPSPRRDMGPDEKLRALVYVRGDVRLSIPQNALVIPDESVAQEGVIQEVTEHVAKWCSPSWLRSGVVSSPELMKPYATKCQASPSLPAWKAYAEEPLALTLTREQVLALQRLLANGTVAAAMREELSERLNKITDLTGLTLGANTLKPTAVDDLLMLAGHLDRGLIKHLRGHREFQIVNNNDDL